MIILYPGKDAQEALRIQEMLEELVLAHQVKPASETGEAILESNECRYQGMVAIKAHIEELANLKEAWDRFQGDSCYCGDDGEII